MAFIQYLTFDGTALPLPDSYEVQMEDVEADSGGETEAGTVQRDVVRLGVVSIPDIRQYLDTDKITDEAQYDGLYAVCTDLLGDKVSDILKVSEGRWQIEECFRIMKTDFSARPVYLQEENRIKAHFLICFLALTLYRFLERKLNSKYTCEELLNTLKAMNFAKIQEQGFVPLYKRERITDALHEASGFRTDYQFITKSCMRTIQKKSKGKE